MVRLQIVSDLHLETMSITPTANSFIEPAADILIMAGDIGRLSKYEQLYIFLRDVSTMFKAVLYVLGNHEFYKSDDEDLLTYEELLLRAEKLQSEIPNLYILNRQSVVIDDVCIIGCTLWSQAINGVPPFIVRIHGMNTEKYNRLFYRDLSYIEHMIDYCRKRGLKLVVVTHHCPTYNVLKKRGKDKFRSLYASNLDHLLTQDKVHTWICGHNHSNFDYHTPLGSRLVSNQRGKPKDNVTDFSLSKTIIV
jgi:predicted phosphohydrolase